jgi:hypothetical protein
MLTQPERSSQLKIVGPVNRFPKVKLIEPTHSGYLLLALEVDRRLPFAYFLESARKRQVVERLRSLAGQLRSRDDVIEATIFKAVLIPPGRGGLLKKRPHVRIARFDVALLIELRTPEIARAFARDRFWSDKTEELAKTARYGISVTAENARRIGPVDHDRPGVFLFNYFYADRLEQNLQVWEYTAGYFQQETGLDNSVLLLPDPGQPLDYKIINHAQWDRLSDVLPTLLFKPSFRSFVLANFAANDTAAIPILYRTA